MTDEQIEALVMARPDMAQAIFHDIVPMGAFVELAKVIAAAEREACAKVCESLRDEWARIKVGATDGRYDMMEEAATVCEDEIRTRPNA